MNDGGKNVVEYIYPSHRDYADEAAIDWWRNLHAIPKRKLSSSLLLSQEEGIKLAAMRPTCGVCGKPVDSMEQTFDGGLYVVLTARCHGEEETMRIPLNDILDLVAAGIGGGHAFVRRRLGETRMLCPPRT